MSISIDHPALSASAVFARDVGGVLPSFVRLCAFLIVMFSASSALAWGFGEMRLQSALGQPLKVQIGLLGDDAGKAEALCFKGSLQSLDGVSLGGVTVALQAENALIRLATTRNINEPAASLIVSYSCPPHIKREYTILLDPAPSRALPVVARQQEAPQPQMSSSESAAQATNVAAGDKPVKKPRRRVQAEPLVATDASAAAAPASVEARASRKKERDKPSEPFKNVLRLGQNDGLGPHPLDGKGGVHLLLSYALRGAALPPASASAAATKEPVVAADQPAVVPAPAPAEDAAALAQAAQASAMTQLMEKIQTLENKTEYLRKQNNLQLTALETAQKNQASTSSDYLLYFLLLVCLVAIAWLMWRMHKIRSNVETSSWQQIVPYDEYPYPERGWEVEQTVAPLAPIADAGTPENDSAGQEQSAAAVVAKVAAAAASFDDADQYYDNRLKVSAAEEISDEMQQAEFWLNMNQPLRAIEVLEAKPDHERPTSPVHWLNLIDLYRLAGERNKYEQMAARFMSVFNARVAPWDDDAAAPENSRGLEGFPVVMDRIVQLWHTEALLSFLENLLIDERDGARAGFDLAAYRDILFLTNIAHGVKAAKRFDKSPAAPDWSIL